VLISNKPDRAVLATLILSRAAAALFLLFIFLLGVKGLGDGFKLLGQDVVEGFFRATADPFVGLIVGLLATTLVQSSSVTTAMIVGLVAAPENPLPLSNAVPMIMGANIGTTVVLLLPLEVYTGFLQKTATTLGTFVQGFGGYEYESPLKTLLSAGMAPITLAVEFIFLNAGAQAIVLIGLSVTLIFTALYLLVRVLRSLVDTRVEGIVDKSLGSSPLLAILVGITITVMVQSSSITTSVLVPLAAAGLLSLERAFPITIGANIGTTITALLAALGVAGPNAIAGLEIALVHLFFNISGTLLIYPVKAIRRVPLRAAQALTQVAIRSRRLTVVVVAAFFYGVPTLILFLTRVL